MKTKSKSFLCVFLLTGYLVTSSLSGCSLLSEGDSSNFYATESGNTAPRSTTSMALLATAVCHKLSGAIGSENSGCYENLTFENCFDGLLQVDNIDTEIGLLENLGTVANIIAIEESRLIFGDQTATGACAEDISALTCNDPRVISAYNESSTMPFENAAEIFPQDEGNCSAVFLQPELTLFSATDNSGIVGEDGDLFGDEIALSTDFAIVGVPFDNDANGDSEGSAYIFQRVNNEWIQTQILIPSDAHSHHHFGSAVAIYEDLVVVGARGHDNGQEQFHNTGAAYIFRYDGVLWLEEAILMASDAQGFPNASEGDHFGWSVAITENLAFVGARYEGEQGNHRGSVYPFTFDGFTWSEAPKITASDGSDGDSFGESLEFSNDRLVVGTLQGESAYVFENGLEVAKLTAWDIDPNATTHFGESVTMENDVIAIGAPLDNNENGTAAGSVYIFRNHLGVWTQEKKLIAPNGGSNDHFGNAVTLSENIILVGAKDQGDNYTGAAYVFSDEANDGNWQEKYFFNDFNENSFQFGRSVALTHGFGLIGAPAYPNPSGVPSGIIYGFNSNL